MAVRVLPRSPARPADHATSLPALVLAVALVPAALDLLQLVQPGLGPYLALPEAVACGAATAVLLLMWLRFPRTSWLAAASLAAAASLVLRLLGGDAAPLFSLLAIVAVGLGGGFATPEASPVSASR
jgi:hypothetical protein